MAAHDRGDPFRIVRLLVFLLRRQGQFAGKDWSAGVLPPSGTTYLAIDGLGTSSYSEQTPFRTFTPWIEDHSFTTMVSDLPGRLHGFSYSSYGKHYGPNHTDITLRGRAADLFVPYAPSFSSAQRVVYVAFSIGGAVAGLGLGDVIGRQRQTVTAIDKRALPMLLLVQPALVLTAGYQEVLDRAGSVGLPAVLRELLDLGDELLEMFVDAIQLCVDAGINVTLIFWPHDQVLAYPASFRERLEQAGATIRQVDYPPDRDQDPFLEHANDSRHPLVYQEIHTALQRF